MKKAIYISLLSLLLLASACNREYFSLNDLDTSIELETGLVAPLAYGSMNMGDMVALVDSLVTIGETDQGVVLVSYSSNMVDLQMDTLDLIGENIFIEEYFSPDIGDDPVYLGSDVGDTVYFPKSKEFRFQTLGDTRVDTVWFKGGKILTEVGCNFSHDGFMIVSSDDLLDANRQPLRQVIEISDVSGVFSGSDSSSMDRYYLFSEKSGDTSTFTLNYEFALINSGNPIYPDDFCEIKTSFLEVDFYSIFGFVDPEEILDQGGILDLPIYRDVPELKNLKLADPQIEIHTQSSTGIPFELTIQELVASNEEDDSLALEFYSGHPFILEAPGYDQVGERVSSDFYINQETSNFRDLLNLAPDTLRYRVLADIDRSAPQEHFVLDTSRLIVDADILVPLDLRITRIHFTDTLAFEGESLDTSMIRELSVRIETENELPLALDLQLYFMDEAYLLLDSLFDDPGDPMLLEPSEVDADGNLLMPAINEKVAALSQEELAGIADLRHMMLKATVVTSDEGANFVKFKSEYDLDFEISFSGKFKLNIEDSEL